MSAGVGVPCPHAGTLPGKRIVCDDCQRERKNARSREWYREHREYVLERSAAYYRAHRERRLEQIRAYYWAHRDELIDANRERYYRDHGATLERKRRDREAVMADPQRAAAHREYHRMWTRLQAERNGHPMPPIPEADYPAASTQWTVPAEQIRPLVRYWTAETGESQAELARLAKVSDRLLRRLMNEEAGLTVAAADRLLVAMGLHLDLVYEQATV